MLVGPHDNRLTAAPPEVGKGDDEVYSEPSDDLGARQFLSSLLRAVIPV